MPASLHGGQDSWVPEAGEQGDGYKRRKIKEVTLATCL